jgi:endonuclease/exonuclease/phosphatase family metal-dependent hydrolase
MGGTPSTEKPWDEKNPGSQPLTSHEKCVDRDTTFPHWRDKTSLTTDEKTGYQLLTLLPGTTLFKGLKVFGSPSAPKRGFYGTFDTAVNYAFRSSGLGGQGEQGKVIVFQADRPIPLFLINEHNLNLLLLNLGKEYKEFRSLSSKEKEEYNEEKEELKKMQRYILQLFGGKVLYDTYSLPTLENERIESIVRKSEFDADLVFSNFLCSRGFQGFASYQLPIFNPSKRTKIENLFPSEVMLCNSALPSLISPGIEYRVHRAFPQCIFEVESKTGEPFAVIDAEKYGKIFFPRSMNINDLPRSDLFVNAMHRLHDQGKLPSWLSDCPCTKYDNDNSYGKEKKKSAIEYFEYAGENPEEFLWQVPHFQIENLLPVVQKELKNGKRRREEEDEESSDDDDKPLASRKTRRFVKYPDSRQHPDSQHRQNQINTQISLQNQVNTQILRQQAVVKSRSLIHELNDFFEKHYLPDLVPGINVDDLRSLFDKFAKKFDNTDKILSKYEDVDSFSDKRVLRIATWNVYMRGKTDEFFDVYQDLDADILVLQEVNFRSDKETMDKFSSLGYKENYFASVNITKKYGQGGLGTMLLTKIPATKSYVVPLPQPLLSGYESDEIPQRSVLFTLVAGIWIVSTHLDAYDKSGEIRRFQVTSIKDLMQEIIPNLDKEPIVWLGDFNALRDSDYSSRQLEWQKAHNLSRNKYSHKPVVRDTKTLELLVQPFSSSSSSLSSLLPEGKEEKKEQEEKSFIDASDLVGERISLTTWAANRVDFIFLRNITPSQILHFFPVITPLSDHLPLVLDLLI